LITKPAEAVAAVTGPLLVLVAWWLGRRPRDSSGRPTHAIPANPRAVAEPLLANLTAILPAARVSLTDAVRVGIVMHALQRDQPVLNNVWAEQYKEHRPAGRRSRSRTAAARARTRGSWSRWSPTVPDISDGFELVASFFTLTGAGFGEEPRYSFAERCRAAAAAGFTGIGLHADDLPRTVASGLDVAGMRAVLADTGLRVVEIEFLGGWALDTDAGELERTIGRIEAVADGFGGQHVSAGEFRGGALLALDATARRLDGLALRLGRRGLQVAVEAFPWSALGGPTAVPELLRRVQAPNVGQLIDVWHFFHNGGDPDALTSPIAAVQLNDGPRVHFDFLVHSRTARRLPGEGELDVTGLLRALLRTGFTGPWCVEVNNPEFRALSVHEAARRAADTASAALDAAGAPRR
jgi:sugar phosphate isomerase/epimerase/enamine deaminase RidA (YjgF/YER057c/UK114 family)